jgi:hypothetical protein
MSADAIPPRWLPLRTTGDDAYTMWFNAQQRCAVALRAWNAAMPGLRAAAYRDYVAALDTEALAAQDLERCHRGSLAA